ncbi:MAG: acyltransferase [Kiritimatiellae bacterium]|jgi:maltose O-acetyltransferase|nr:acyltransferase [Kiritimatiellia bacterium]
MRFPAKTVWPEGVNAGDAVPEFPEKEEIIYMLGQDPLIKVRKITRIFLAWHAHGIRCVRPLLQKWLNLPADVDLEPGVNFKSGQVYCEKNVNLGNTLFVDYAPIYIAEYVGFAFNNTIVTSSHDPENFKRAIIRPVVIERNVSITTNVTILGGVRIGENSIIGAGSVVTKSIPPNVFAAGNPCVPIKEINRDLRR